LLFLIAHFHKAALLSMSDELAVAMNRLEVGDTESVRHFKRTIRQSMEVFLRFTHRYWFHEVSNQDLARSIFTRLTRHLGNDALYEEVRNEVADMNEYLDTDSVRRQAQTILRLTVVTIFGLIGTVATGFLGMNLLAEAEDPLVWRVLLFVLVLALTGGITLYTVVKSKVLADFLDALSDERMSWPNKWRVLTRVRRP
jgi:Mg2+ and Co2+ transporter CorA